MRCFLALGLPPAAQKSLSVLQAELKALHVQAAFPKTDLHVTLAFFGEISERKAEEKKAALAQFSFPAFDAVLQDVGFFPSQSRVNVVWAGFGAGRQKLVELQHAVATRLAYRDEKPFFPHVTLARVKQKPDLAALQEWAQTWRAKPLATFRAEAVTLYQSVLGPAGSQYRPLASVRLR